MNKSIIALLIIVNLLLLPACDEENNSLDKYIDNVKSRPPESIIPLPSFEPVPSFKYVENANNRDPFKKPEAVKKIDLTGPNPNRKKEPLELFPLDALKFVGILKQGNYIWGLIAQPNGKITKITVGNYMGQNYGKVLVIKQTSLVLQELIKNQGKWEKQLITLNLNIGKEEGAANKSN